MAEDGRDEAGDCDSLWCKDQGQGICTCSTESTVPGQEVASCSGKLCCASDSPRVCDCFSFGNATGCAAGLV